jgi:ABC-2 type transport system permease protein/lipopolysaccharide transport system permease protein
MFLLRYRKTSLGPAWILAGPAAFILILGTLFGNVMGHQPAKFVPHLAVGLIVWQYLVSIASTAPRLYIAHRASLMLGHANHMQLVMRAIFSSLLMSLHHTIIIIAVMLIYRVAPTASLFYLIPAGLLMFAHSVWMLVMLGILGARYRDLSEVVEMVMRIAFLATPIIWMVGEEHGRGSIVGVYLVLNPFYHVLEPVRGAILGTPIDPLSWVISAAIAVGGLLLANILYKRYRHLVVLWI